MALLQLAEPGLATAPHEHRLAVGIDLGTTNSLAASVFGGEARVLPDERGRRLLPSVVRYVAGNPAVPVIGHEALARQAEDPANTIASVKRLMGRRLADLKTRTPYRLVDGSGMVGVETSAGTKSPVEISAAILTALRERSEATLGGPLTGAVITVPAYFDDAQRQATKDAARLAGIKVLRLLNEPTAAAIAYGLDRRAEGLFAVYDLGGGTFDISVLRLTRGVFEVLATGGDSALGGDDFDHAIADWIAGPGAAPGGSTLKHLLGRARAAKEKLSAEQAVPIHDAVGIGGESTGGRILDRGTFEKLAAPLVERTIRATRKALKDAGIEAGAVDGVVLVGGSTRMPCVRRAVAEFFGREPFTDLDPDEAVAIGAAMQADVLAGNRREADWLLLDVCPLSVGLETMGGLAEKIIPRNSTLPTARAQDFTTFKDGQSAMEIHVVQGERELVSQCRSLARFTLRGIPPMTAGAARIRVAFQIDADGLLEVSAHEVTTGVQARIEVRPSYGLDDSQVTTLLAEAQAAATDDARLRQLREAQVDARRLIDATEAALEADGASLLSPPERTAIEAALHRLAEVLSQGDEAVTSQLRVAGAALNAATTEFAGRRMNAGITRALAGASLDSLA